MKARLILPVLFLVGVFGVAVAGGQEQLKEPISNWTAIAWGQERLQEPIPNWAAPATWSPVRSEEGLTTMAAVTSPFPFIGLTPCRIADTRQASFPAGYGPPALTGGAPRNFTLTGQCGIPASAAAVSLNVTVTNTQGPGFILIYPQGGAQPNVSTLNYVAGQTIANAAVVPLGTGGGVTVIAGVSGTDLILDTNGYYAGGVGTDNTFLGANAGNFTLTGGQNTAMGSPALSSITTGSFNTALGSAALITNTTGTGNTAIGRVALIVNTGDNNTAVGRISLSGNTSGSFNTALGVSAGSSLTTGSNNIDIGSLQMGVAGESATTRIGVQGTQTAAFIAGISNATVSGVPVLVSGTGQLGVATSSARFKDAIRDMGDASHGLMRLRPVTFRYKPEIDPTGLEQYGLVAEEVARVYPDLVVCGEDGRPEAVRYQLLAPMLLNEVQNQERTIEQQREQIKALAGRLLRLEELIGSQAASVSVSAEMSRSPSQ